MKKNSDWVNKMVIFGPLVILIFMAFYHKRLTNTPGMDYSNFGSFGDSFGAFTAFFSALAFLGVLITIYLQMEELRETREELRKSAKAQAESSRALQEQLLSMKLSTHIEALTSASIQDFSTQEIGKLAKSLLSKLTESILFLEEYESVARPNIYFHLMEGRKYKVWNLSQSFIILDIKEDSGIVSHEFEKIGLFNSSKIIIEFDDVDCGCISLVIKGSAIGHIYRVEFKYTKENGLRILEAVPLRLSPSNSNYKPIASKYETSFAY